MIPEWMGSQSSLNIIGVIESYFLVNITVRTAVFWTRCNLETKYFGIPYRGEMQ